MTAVRLIDLPDGVKGFVRELDDCYTIVLNAKLSHDQLLETYLHELEHLKRKDFDRENADLIESEAHND